MRKTLIECALSIRRGEITSSELVSTASQEIKKYGKLNAFLEVDTVRSLECARNVSLVG
jgi:Asp-tRNA(Asn)/Glu-tRNA(Gln) amidotransferase A subunit family amidase